MPAAPGAPSPAALALGLPGLLCAIGILLFAAARACGLVPAPGDYRLTLAEAAALHDIAEIVRRVRSGDDPRHPAEVRAGIIRPQPMTLTPMAAAILERRVDVIALLTDIGARIRTEEFASYVCLAREGGDAAVIAAIEAQASAALSVDCRTVPSLLEPADAR